MVLLATLRFLAVAFSAAMVFLVASSIVEFVPVLRGFVEWVGHPLPGIPPGVELLVAATLAVGFTAGKVFVFFAGGFFGLKVGLGEVLLPRYVNSDTRLRVVRSFGEITGLHGRPGLGVYLTLDVSRLLADDRVEFVARMRSPGGAYVPAALPAFRGADGEMKVRREYRPTDADPETDEVGIFLPVLAADLAGARRFRGVVEVLVFLGGEYQSEVAVPAAWDLDDPALGLDLLAPKAPLEEEIEVLADAILAADAACQVCGDRLVPTEPTLVHCGSCATPHHSDCWDFVGQCTTFACEGRPRPGPPETRPVAAPQVAAAPLPRADVRRQTDAPAAPHASVPAVAVPRAPRSIWDFRPVALGYAVALTATPLVAALALAAVSPWIFGLMVAAVAAFAVAVPRGALELLLLPGNLARPVLARAFPAPAARDFSHYIRLRRVDADARAPAAGGGVGLTGKLLVRGLKGHRLDFTLRLRVRGGYLAAVKDPLTGVYGELRLRHSTEALPGEDAEALAFRVAVPGDAIRVDTPGASVPVAAELLVSCDGEVLSEADVPGRFAHAAKPDAAAAAAWEVTRPDEAARAAACPLCADEMAGRWILCRDCQRRSHQGCWSFVGVCGACGSPNAH